MVTSGAFEIFTGNVKNGQGSILRKKFMGSNREARLLSIQVAIREKVDEALTAINELEALSTEIAETYVANRFEITKQMIKRRADVRTRLESNGYDPDLFTGFFNTWYEAPALTRTPSAQGWIKTTLTAIITNVREFFPADDNAKRWSNADYRSAACVLAASALLLESYAFPYSEKAYRQYAISATMFLDDCFRRLLLTSYDEEVERFNLDLAARQEQLNREMGSISKATMILAMASLIVSLIALAVTISSCSDTGKIISAIQDQTYDVVSRVDAYNRDSF